MKKVFLLKIFFIFCFRFSLGQSVSVDSVSINQNNKWHVGVYFMPTYGYNIGKKVYPEPFSINSDQTNFSDFQSLKEKKGIGYNVGFEIESKKVLKKLSLSLGLNLENFSYTGKGEVTNYDYMYLPPQVSGPFPITYSYKDNFINLPILCHYLLFINKTNRLNVLLGGSGSYFYRETNSGYEGNEFEYWHGKDYYLTVFGIAGIDYFYGKKFLLNLGFRISSQITTTPNDRRLASIGIKVGLFY